MKKVNLSFPALQKGIKSSKDNPENAPYNYVSIYSGHAIVVTPYVVICVNLEDYFLNYHTIHEEEREGFRELMNWMEGKFFTVEFWNYLTSKNEIYVIDDNMINVAGDNFEKQLIYSHKEISLQNVLSILKLNWDNGMNQISSIAINNNNLKTIDTTLGKLIATKALIFQFQSSGASTIRFTVEDMNCLFGIILSSNDCLSKPFNFEQLKQFTANI